MPASTSSSQMQMPREPAPAAFPAERTSTEQPVCGTIKPPARPDSVKYFIVSQPKPENSSRYQQFTD
jgi:hypothetical protein